MRRWFIHNLDFELIPKSFGVMPDRAISREAVLLWHIPLRVTFLSCEKWHMWVKDL